MPLKFTTLLFLIFAFSTQALGQPAAWRVTGEKGEMTLFGTFHSLPAETDWFSAELETAFENSRLLVLETESTQIADDYIGYVLRQPGVKEGRKSLKSLLGETDFNILLERVLPFGYTEEEISQYRPWYAVLVLGGLKGEEVGLEFNRGPEKILTDKAKSLGKDIHSLESPAQQVRFFSELPKKVELAWLKYVLNNPNTEEAAVTPMFDVWINGDMDGIEQNIFEGSFAQIQELYEVFFKNRQENWAKQLSKLLEEGGNIFVAIGAAHMTGPDSVLHLLEKKGYQVTRIQ